MKKFRLLVLECVADELEHPPQQEKHNRIKPQPMNEDTHEEEADRNQNRRNPKGVADPVYRVLMAARILRDPLFVSAAAQHGDSIIHA